MPTEDRRTGPGEPRPRGAPAALTIAGSDSGGGAGIQADLKAFGALGVFGTSAITCLTAQNPDAVRGVTEVAPEMVALQVRAVCEAFPVGAAKTGMLYSAPIVRAVAETVRACRLPRLVVDPVMVATSGARLLRDDAVAALTGELLPAATVVTPNVPEAEILCGHGIDSAEALCDAAAAIARRYGVACAAKGGHLGGPCDEVLDVLFADGACLELRGPRVAARETHGTGCTFSAAMAAWLARGADLRTAFARAKAYVRAALSCARRVGAHFPLGVPPFEVRGDGEGEGP